MPDSLRLTGEIPYSFVRFLFLCLLHTVEVGGSNPSFHIFYRQGRKHDKINQNCLLSLVYVCFGVVTLIIMFSGD
jgi:hypothetical protein